MSKKSMKRVFLGVAGTATLLGSGVAFAGVPVIDVAVGVNTGITAASSIVTNIELIKLRKSLAEGGKGSMISYTQNIDNSVKDMRVLTKNIDESVTSIDQSITDIQKVTNLNYNIDASFQWITNNYYDGDSGIIPTGAEKKFAEMLGEDKVEGYMAKFKDAESYQDTLTNPENLSEVGLDGSKMQKTANDALVSTLSSQRDLLKRHAPEIEKIVKDGLKVEGHGHELQVANAIAGTQAVQLLEMRTMMLGAYNAQAAAAQATADRESRQLASSYSLRKSLPKQTSSNSELSAPQF